MTVTNWP